MARGYRVVDAGEAELAPGPPVGAISPGLAISFHAVVVHGRGLVKSGGDVMKVESVGGIALGLSRPRAVRRALRARIVLLLPLLLGCLVLSAQPASAAVVAVDDRPQPAAPPRIDLTKGRYFNGAKQVRFHAHLVDLRRTTGAVGFDMLDPEFGNTFYRVWLTKRSGRLDALWSSGRRIPEVSRPAVHLAATPERGDGNNPAPLCPWHRLPGGHRDGDRCVHSLGVRQRLLALQDRPARLVRSPRPTSPKAISWTGASRRRGS